MKSFLKKIEAAYLIGDQEMYDFLKTLGLKSAHLCGQSSKGGKVDRIDVTVYDSDELSRDVVQKLLNFPRFLKIKSGGTGVGSRDRLSLVFTGPA